MSWQTILLIVLTALLLFVWLPWLIISIRRLQRETSRRPASSCHPELDPRHSGLDPCHPEFDPCHPGLDPGSPTTCHPEPVEGSPTESETNK